MLWTGLAGSFFASAAIVVSASPGALGASVGFFWSTRRMAWVVLGIFVGFAVSAVWMTREAPGAARSLSATPERWEVESSCSLATIDELNLLCGAPKFPAALGH